MNTKFLKNNIRDYYNKEAQFRNNKSEKPDWKIEEREMFLEMIKKEKKETLLELGAGVGYDSQFFKNNGLRVIAVDISKEMILKCREKSIEAYEIDYYKLSTLNKKFDCIWALNTLLHVPKSDLPQVLEEINSVLEENGLVYIGLYGGNDTEEELIKIEISEIPRFFTFYSDTFLKTLLKDVFEILNFKTLRINYNKTEEFIFHSIILKKKN